MIIGIQSVSQQLSLSLKKYTTEQIESYKDLVWKQLNDEIHGWETKVQEALSTPLPKELYGRRTTPRDRLFPYLRSGKLEDSVSVHFTERKGRSGSFTFALSGRISSPHGQMTNDGVNSDGKIGWLHWRDDILSGDGRGGIRSLRLIFDDIKHFRRSK